MARNTPDRIAIESEAIMKDFWIWTSEGKYINLAKALELSYERTTAAYKVVAVFPAGRYAVAYWATEEQAKDVLHQLGRELEAKSCRDFMPEGITLNEVNSRFG